MSPNDEYNRDLIISHLEQASYWLDRFELSRDVNHLDNAERHAEVVRQYSPKCFHRLSMIGIYNLYLSLHPLSVTASRGS